MKTNTGANICTACFLIVIFGSAALFTAAAVLNAKKQAQDAVKQCSKTYGLPDGRVLYETTINGQRWLVNPEGGLQPLKEDKQ